MKADKTNTPDEVVDVVDENDQVVGKATKAEVNSNPKLIHREIAILIYDNSGKILLQQRSKNKKVFPLWWTMSVCGHVPTGMGPEAAAHMELKEEMGFDTDLVQYVKLLLRYPNETHFAYGFIGKMPAGTKLKVDKNEIEDVKFVNEVELEKMIAEGTQTEEYSLEDFRKFFRGEYNHLIAKL